MSNENHRAIGMSNTDYHNLDSVSKSTLDLFSEDPQKPIWSRKCPQDQEKIKTFDFGDAMHAICLEPDRLKTEFVVMPVFNIRNNDGKASKKSFEAEHEALKILTEGEYKKLELMFESVMSHPQARALIEADGVAESSFFWKDEKTGVQCKCRPDKHITSQNLLVDVKTTPELKKFCYSVDDFRYYVQDPWYCDGVSRFFDGVRMEFLVIQKNIEIGRYPVMVCKLPPEAIEYGRSVYRENLNSYAEYLQLETEPETQELSMGYKFYQKAEEHFGEVF